MVRAADDLKEPLHELGSDDVTVALTGSSESSRCSTQVMVSVPDEEELRPLADEARKRLTAALESLTA